MSGDFGIRLDGIYKRFDGAVGVADVSLSVRRGETYGLLGPNGSGKSVVLKTAVGLMQPDAGSVVIGDVNLLHDPLSAKRHLGYVPNDPTGYDRLTSRELLEFAGRVHGLGQDVRDRRIDELLERFGLTSVADVPFGSCSRDARQRLAVTVALLPEPAVIVADEPWSWLDPRAAKEVREALAEFVRDGGALLLATHQLSVVENYCDRFGFMSAGRLVAQGDLAALRRLSDAPSADLESCYLRLVP